MRRGYQVFIGDNHGREIDFVARRGPETFYIQVTTSLASRGTVEREFSAFAGIPDSFPRIVVSADELDMSMDGVRHYNIRRILLAEKWA